MPSALDVLNRATAPEGSAVPMPRAMLVFAHPDDETVALGGRLSRFAAAHLVHITDGAPRNEQDAHAHGFPSFHDYRAARAAELTSALRLAGLEHMSRECLEIPDQQSALRLADVTCDVLLRIERHQPEIVFTHPYEGGHPDHDACAFAVHLAVEIYSRRGNRPPLIIECTLYHAGPEGIHTGAFLPDPSPLEIHYALTPDEQRKKRALLDCFTTQRDTLSYFSCTDERYRLAPAYDFTRPPHTPPVFYDRYPWGMTSERFCRLAEEAQTALTDHQESACR